MKKSGTAPIKVALFGMDPRTLKTMELYLKGPCRGIAIVVEESEAEIDIIDADFATAGEILSTRRELNPQRPIILLSLQILKVENTHFVQKPVKAEQLTGVLSKIKSELSGSTKQTRMAPGPSSVDARAPTGEPLPIDQKELDQQSDKTAKKRRLFEDNEGGYAVFLGTLSGIDFDDPDQLRHASFDPRKYFLSYVFSAYKVACHENRTLQLKSIWKPLVIFPDARQVWLDADDKQLRAFAGVEQNKMFASNINLGPIDGVAFKEGKQAENFQDMDVFIWKLAVWTSKGRFPQGLEPNHPVYLKYWPNFTRLLLTPEAMRIASLLLQGPRTPLDIVKVLDVKPQYVFAFISACHSLGILGRSERRVDEIIAPEPPKHSKKQGLLSKILHKLRGD
ncbi:MAG: hypothetical protein ACU836_08135 [Gammaproteobacteria bacterium]